MTTGKPVDTFVYVSPRQILLNEIESLQAQRDALLLAAEAAYTQLSQGIAKKHFSHSDPDGRGKEGTGCYASLGVIERLGEAILAAKGGAE